jgi:hypothetical protein
MGSRYKIVFGIWTGAILFIFGIIAAGAATAPTCGALSSSPCPELELVVVLAVGVVLLVVWAIGAVPFLSVYRAKHRRRRYRNRA